MARMKFLISFDKGTARGVDSRLLALSCMTWLTSGAVQATRKPAHERPLDQRSSSKRAPDLGKSSVTQLFRQPIDKRSNVDDR
jgi:hypothetical protein